jgi:archaemetzincin
MSAAPGVILLEWIGGRAGDAALLDHARRAVEAAFGMSTALRTVNGPPEETWDPRRRQRSSTKILRWMLGHLPEDAVKVVAITDADLFIPVLTFVFGEAQMGGAAAVVSTARLRQTYDGRPASPQSVEARLVKECLHELGHTFGLVHCTEPRCVMSRSNSILDVDRKQADFCRACRQRLRELVPQGSER